MPRDQTPDENDQVVVKITGHFYASQVCVPYNASEHIIYGFSFIFMLLFKPEHCFSFFNSRVHIIPTKGQNLINGRYIFCWLPLVASLINIFLNYRVFPKIRQSYFFFLVPKNTLGLFRVGLIFFM